MDHVILLFLLCVGASFVQSTTGFGFGIFIMTALPYLMPSYGEATTLSGLLALTTSAVLVIRLYRYVTWNRLWLILLTFTLVSAAAIYTLTTLHGRVLSLMLGVVLVLTSLYFIFFSDKIHVRPTPGVQVGAGALSGLMGGFFGMQGPPAVLYFISSEPDKTHYMAMAQTYFLVGNVLMTGVRAMNGFLTPTVLTDYLYGLGGVLLGTLLGTWLFRYIPSRLFRYVVYAYIGISGLIICFS